MMFSCMIVFVCLFIGCVCFFFKQKTAYEMRISDWSSDVCSSDLLEVKAAMIDGDRSAAVIAIASRVSEDAPQTDALLRAFLEHNLAGAERLLRFDSPPSGAGSAAGPCEPGISFLTTVLDGRRSLGIQAHERPCRYFQQRRQE